jgi:carbohydrate-selective porin OprB
MGWSDDLSDRGYELGLEYKAEVAGDLSGGLRAGSTTPICSSPRPTWTARSYGA